MQLILCAIPREDMTVFYKIEIHKTEWEVPDRYQSLTPVGSGAYGQVWLVLSVLPIYTFVVNKTLLLSYTKLYSVAINIPI